MITSPNPVSTYTGNGVATIFAYVFPVTNPAYIEVVQTDTSGGLKTLVLNVDYTVQGVSNPSNATWTITLAAPLANAYTLSIAPLLPITQLVNLNNQGGFYSQDVMSAFDNLTLISQQIQAQVDNCVQVPLGSTQSPSPTAILTAINTAATNSAASATAAAGFATTAGTAAGTATTQATNASTSATTAQTAATTATTQATAAGNSAATAQTAATNAGNSATAAAGSATTATTQATNAAGSATTASTAATNAGNSATTAQTAATNAGNSATTATTQATNAVNSAAAAATSAASIQPYDINQYAASASTANTYTATLSPAPAAYAAGMHVAVVFTNANTGAATLNLNGLGAKSIQYNGAALTAGQIAAGLTGALIYDGANFQLINPAQPAVLGFLAKINFNGLSVTGLAYTRSGMTVTVTQTGHGYSTGMIAEITAATDTGVNGHGLPITVTGANTYTFQTTGTGANGTLTLRSLIKSQYNIASVVSASTGVYTLTFATALTNTSYIPVASGALNTTGYNVTCVVALAPVSVTTNTSPALKTTTQVQITTVLPYGGNAYDCNEVNVALL